MKNYLSSGMGVNSVAMHLMLLDQGADFEAVFVNTGADWPETYEYLDMFQKWLHSHKHNKITIITAEYEGVSGLYEYCKYRKILPAMWPRWCTIRFKLDPIYEYYTTPCFQYLGIDSGEAKRAKISSMNGVESRFPLIEHDIDRNQCVEIIKKHNLPVPQKSGCYICPFQKISDWKRLRRIHPELFCKAVYLEKLNTEYRKTKNKGKAHLHPSGKQLFNVVEENQMELWSEDKYPPCQCGQ